MTPNVPGQQPSAAELIASSITSYRTMTPELARQLLALRARWRDIYHVRLSDDLTVWSATHCLAGDWG